jgi:hypothetical protein
MSKRKRQDGVNLCQVECRRAEIEILRRAAKKKREKEPRTVDLTSVAMIFYNMEFEFFMARIRGPSFVVV